MGETAAKLFAIFESMRHTRGIYLFDEFDAIGSMREGSNDIGEIRRVLNSFLQFLEQDESDGMIIAATNLEAILDDALFRRFDDFIRYELPSEAERRTLIENRLSAFKIGKRDLGQFAKASDGLSHSDLSRACDQAAKLAVLADRRGIAKAELEKSIRTFRERKHAVR